MEAPLCHGLPEKVVAWRQGSFSQKIVSKDPAKSRKGIVIKVDALKVFEERSQLALRHDVTAVL